MPVYKLEIRRPAIDCLFAIAEDMPKLAPKSPSSLSIIEMLVIVHSVGSFFGHFALPAALFSEVDVVVFDTGS